MSTLVYLVGPPAAGKSTLMAELTAACTRATALEVDWSAAQVVGPHVPYEFLSRPNRGAVAVELGAQRRAFSGTDALPMDINPKACAWIAVAPYELVLGEGDRLANLAFLTAAADAGREVWLVSVDAPDAVLDQRCAARHSTQTAAWRVGRATKAARLLSWFEQHWGPRRLVTVDGARPTGELAGELIDRIPALVTLSA